MTQITANDLQLFNHKSFAVIDLFYKEGPMEGGSISNKLSQLLLIDILYAEVYRQLGEKALDNKKKTSQVITDKMM